FWPHHYRMGSRYRNEIIPRVRTRSPRLFVEVGTGSAMYTLLTMSALPDVRGIGYDISPHSITFGRRVAKAFGFSDRFTFVEQDAFANPPEDKADYVVSQEVLEHLEDPLTFCKNLHRILKDDGYAYITAAVTAAHSDHIYLFKTPEELLSMLEGAGFRSVMYIEESSIDTRVPEKTPRICGHLLEKA
ncbi:MAG: class I SAM-dependent methyltransferase, partial [Proteobacteria bacterium]|nr:class I SAM-dependent methyltransferase [Pseudomonadota bacterium]